ncbi:enediyne biosynthesis protein [Actinomadura sp. 7K534]|uniref:enediyne biosynthesis protein n=1 Tax=Actinomadura sp. 7K534 TaxID=2530366 RepID=UPI001053D1FA|nr:enediyne biosynthesis protein [Actinomadura sp. 7K534]TDB96419.1 enediyne biosynthesis protein [Actinomadura sp. 7K534]
MTKPARDPRIIALRNFAASISVFNVFGYLLLGFEQPPAWPFIAMATAYALELLLETIGARGEQRAPRFLGNGLRGLVEFLYPAHITALAVNMLVYVNDRVSLMIFGVVVAISGKWLLRAPVRGRMRHFMNPSNFGIVAILLVAPWASVAPPYQFTEHVANPVDWIIPIGIIVLGTMLNGMLTKRMWLIGAWVAVFALQAVVRGVLFDTSIPAALGTMTGVAFVLFTNYMLPDPGTTPLRPLSQVAFGGGAAAFYGLVTGFHMVYGLFFATVLVCLTRGAFLWALHIAARARDERAAEEERRAAAVLSGAAEPAVPVPSPNEREAEVRA